MKSIFILLLTAVLCTGLSAQEFHTYPVHHLDHSGIDRIDRLRRADGLK